MVTDNPGFGKRRSHGVVVFNGKIWIMGGEDGAGGSYSDIWNSSDGKTWTQVIESAPWGKRGDVQALVMNDKIWLFGGFSPKLTGMLDVWSSSDGINWVKEVDNIQALKRYLMTSLLVNNRILLMGGINPEDDSYNDIWQSENGKDWTQVTAAANWSKRDALSSAFYDNKIWIIAGFASKNINDVWSCQMSTSIAANNKFQLSSSPVSLKVIGSNQLSETLCLAFWTPQSVPASLNVFNSAGCKIAAAWSGYCVAGENVVSWNCQNRAGTPISRGTYILQCKIGNASSVITIVK